MIKASSYALLVCLSNHFTLLPCPSVTQAERSFGLKVNLVLRLNPSVEFGAIDVDFWTVESETFTSCSPKSNLETEEVILSNFVIFLKNLQT